MINRKKLQQILFLVIFVNCCLVLLITSISLGTENWIIAKPIRQISDSNLDSSWKISLPAIKNSSLYKNISFELSRAIEETNDYFGSDEDSELYLPIDLAKNDCKRYNGKIKFGLFKGVWLLNYAYGCKNRITRVSIIDMLIDHKIFDFTLWISTIVCCSLSLFSTLISSIFSLLNIFLSPNRTMNGPISMYLWNSLAGLFHILSLLLFTLEFHLFIKKNILTKDEIESGWTSANRAYLSWSFYILLASILLILVNLALIYFTVRLKRSFVDLKNRYEPNINLINGDTGLIVGDPGLIRCSRTNKNDYSQMVDFNQPNINLNDIDIDQNNENQFNFNSDLRSSKKLKKIIDFIY